MALLNEKGLSRFWMHVLSKLSTKVDKVSGKDLSTNDYTTAEKEKLESIQVGAQVNTVNSVNGQTGDVVINIDIDTSVAEALQSANAYTDTEVSKFTSGASKVKSAINSDTATEATHAISADNATTAETATKLGSSSIGSTIIPIYLNNGTATKVSAVGIAYGGTGASNEEDARNNLGVYSKTEVDTALNNKADSSHNHDSDYYTEVEIDSKFDTVNASIANITNGTTIVPKATQSTKAEQDANGNIIVSTYETKEDATSKLQSANKYTDDAVKDGTKHTHSNATASNNGFMTSDMVVKLDSIDEGANKTVIDTDLSTTSENPVQNKVVNNALSGKVPTSRTVNGKALSSNISLTASDVGADASGSAANALEEAKSYTDTAVSEKANANHNHDNVYASKSHGHTISDVTNLQSTLDGKASLSHKHDELYDAIGSAEDALESSKDYTDSVAIGKADVNHSHDSLYDSIGSAEDALEEAKSYTNAEVLKFIDGTSKVKNATNADNATNATNANVATKLGSTSVGSINIPIYLDSGTAKKISAVSVSYGGTGATTESGARTNLGVYSKTEVDDALNSKASSIHNHDDKYDTKGSANTALTNAKTYTDNAVKDKANSVHSHENASSSSSGFMSSTMFDKLSGIADGANKTIVDTTLSSTSTNPVQNKVINEAIVNAKAYAESVSASVKDDLLNGAGAAYDTLKELGDLIDDNKDAIDALEIVAAGKANATHAHKISDVTDLQNQLNAKVAQTSFDTHVNDTTKHITSTERTNWNSAKSHADSAHAPVNAEVNQNAFSNIIVGSTTIAADTKTDSLTLAGSNVTITPDATIDKVTIGITKTNVTSALGYTPINSSDISEITSTEIQNLFK